MTMSPRERLIPGGRIEMIFNFGSPMRFLLNNDLANGQAITNAQIMGQRSHICYTKQNGDTNLLGVRFKPGAMSAFATIPAAVLLNQIVQVEDVLSSASREWQGKLLEKKNESERICLLDELLSQILKGPAKGWPDCNKAVDIIRNSNVISVNVLCNENESYYKKLERDFLRYVGYTPKYFYRLVRFNKAIRQMRSTENSLTSICYNCGYYDQSHFIKDFHQFTGTTPKHFQKEHNVIAGFLLSHQAV